MRLRVLGVRIDEKMRLRCTGCVSRAKCLMDIDWERWVRGAWIILDYRILCCNCINNCRSGAVYAWRVH